MSTELSKRDNGPTESLSLNGEPTRLFVYGSLRPDAGGGQISRQYLEGATILGEAVISGDLYRVAWYPGVKPTTEEGHLVRGYVFELPLGREEDYLRRLDRFEGYVESRKEDSLFVREEVEATLNTLSKVKAWVYYYNEPVSPSDRVESGDFLQRGEEN
jgi:gamma-glutamylcyclotransferase (GGCT)/AIG2-like uncharacterized protein YtfP